MSMTAAPSNGPRHGIFYYVFWGVVSLIVTVCILIFIFFLVAGLMVGGLSAAKQRAVAQSQSAQVTNASPEITMTESRGALQDRGGIKVTGVISNNTAQTLGRLVIRLSLEDGEGNKVDDAIDVISSLKPGRTWKFEASSFRSSARRYHVEGVWADGQLLVVERADQKKRAEAKRERDQEEQARIQGVVAYNEQVREVNAAAALARKQQTEKTVFEFHRLRAMNGVGLSQLKLGQFYLTGQGTETNRELARVWFRAAATNDQPEAVRLLNSIPR